MGAILEGYFGFKEDGLTLETAEQIGLGLSKYVRENKEKFSIIDVEKSKEANEIVYKEGKEILVIPDENKGNSYGQKSNPCLDPTY